MKCPFYTRVSELRVGDKFRFTFDAATIYPLYHPGIQVGGIDFILMQVMCCVQYTFYSNDGLIVRHAFPVEYNYEVVLLKRDDS